MAAEAGTSLKSRSYIVGRSIDLSTPRPVVAFPCGSESMRRILRSFDAKEALKLIAVVVFPTPPFWLAIAIILPILDTHCWDCSVLRDVFRVPRGTLSCLGIDIGFWGRFCFDGTQKARLRSGEQKAHVSRLASSPVPSSSFKPLKRHLGVGHVNLSGRAFVSRQGCGLFGFVY